MAAKGYIEYINSHSLPQYNQQQQQHKREKTVDSCYNERGVKKLTLKELLRARCPPPTIDGLK